MALTSPLFFSVLNEKLTEAQIVLKQQIDERTSEADGGVRELEKQKASTARLITEGENKINSLLNITQNIASQLNKYRSICVTFQAMISVLKFDISGTQTQIDVFGKFVKYCRSIAFDGPKCNNNHDTFQMVVNKPVNWVCDVCNTQCHQVMRWACVSCKFDACCSRG